MYRSQDFVFDGGVKVRVGSDWMREDLELYL
jgi:hypothetical protein